VWKLACICRVRDLDHGSMKDSTKGHKNLAKLNGSQASICRRFILLYLHMALVGNMTLRNLSCFIFKRNHPRFSPYYEMDQDQHSRTISY
jgi:hypothetical protein